MGSSSSKFKKYLHHGDEFAAMQVFQSSPELQKNLNPNLSYGEHHNHDTALHYAAKHGMKHLLRTFLSDLGGNPNKKNGSNETSLHAACQLTNNKSFSAMERRAACVSFIMQWRGAQTESGGREKIDLAAQDQNGNTALHVAAASGLEHCVHSLINAGSPLFIENNDKLTPCDMAVKNGHHSIAQLLESKMVFGDALDFHNEDDLSQSISESDEVYCGLRTQDLQEAKDQLLVETSDMLQVPLFTAEALLRDNEWSRELLLEKWMKDAVACCNLAGVEPTESAFSQNEVTLESIPTPPVEPQDNVCDICMLSMKDSDKPSIRISCNHNFCYQCWETYLSNKIIEGMQHNILCPAYKCNILVPIDVIERLVSPDLARRYLHFDIKAFVESNKCIKWCPVAGCGRAVRLPETEQIQPTDELMKNVQQNGKPPPLTSHAVDCGNGHFFCWECLGEAHAPSGCLQWRQWLDKVNQVKPEQLSSDMKDLEDASNCLWLVSNSKPCPNCKSPIQKNEGCNHIKCSKCKFDFCWVCLEAWKKHSSATGGYFRCNRFPAVSKADEKQGMLISEAVARSQQIQELNRFLHYYTRFKNHEHSRKLEESLLTAVKHKMEVLASSLANGKEVLSEKERNCTKFIEDGVRELLKARRVLCGSYVHGFYLEDQGYNKTIFEFMQNELEAVTEKLSEMIARPYLKTPRHTIMQTTALSRRKRHEFVRAVSKGLIPPETPPTFRKKKRRFPGVFVMDTNNDEEMSHVIVASLKSLDANNPWTKDDQGRHNNLSAIYEWPDYDSDEETEVSRAVAVSLVGECSREGCNRPKARNPRTQALHEFCSLRCARRSGIQVQSVTHDDDDDDDDSMDLIIALEMSRLQMIEDTIKRENQSANKPNTSVSIITQTTDSDTDLSKAIELSMRQQKTDIGVIVTEETNSFDESATESGADYFRRANEDLTVNCFLKTLVGQNLHYLNENSAEGKAFAEKELFRPHPTEDGRFEISDIHETCFHPDEKDELCLRRVRSTGDLCHKDGKKDQFREEHRYHLDSDHSSQHDDKPEDISQRLLTGIGNSSKIKSGRQYLLFHERNSERSVVDEGACNHDSIEETKTTVTDSLIADLEVCNILSSNETERKSINKLFTYKKINSNLTNPTDEIVVDPAQSEDSSVQSVQNPPTYDNIKNNESNEEKLRKSSENKKGSTGWNSCLRATGMQVDATGIKKSESVKNLIEEAKNALKSVEEGVPRSVRGPELIHSELVVSSPNRTKWQTSVFDFDSTGDFLRQCPERASTGKIKSNNHHVFSCHSKSSGAKSAIALENLKESESDQLMIAVSERSSSKKVLLLGSEKSLNEAHKKAFRAAGGKILYRKDSLPSHGSRECLNKTGSNLRIRIAKSPVATDSSNEYETDTGIPKSPTLFISGVSISRTPEPKDQKSPEHKGVSKGFSPSLKNNLSHLQGRNNSSPVLNLIPASIIHLESEKATSFSAVDGKLLFPADHLNLNDKIMSCVRQSRSSSLTVPNGSDSQVDSDDTKSLNASCGTISHISDKRSRKGSCHGLPSSSSPIHSITSTGCEMREIHFPIKNEVLFSPHFLPAGDSPGAKCECECECEDENLTETHPRKGGKSKSASEPEREREMFRFPKSSTDGALSSVLHVQESNLSSDDFHEVLFLLERSPKHGSKRKKKSKKERDKAKENSNKDECTEISSAL